MQMYPLPTGYRIVNSFPEVGHPLGVWEKSNAQTLMWEMCTRLLVHVKKTIIPKVSFLQQIGSSYRITLSRPLKVTTTK
jgi:hypothetical protein